MTDASHMSAVDVGCRPAPAALSTSSNLGEFLNVVPNASKTSEGADTDHSVLIDDGDEFEGMREEVSDRSDDEPERANVGQADRVPPSEDSSIAYPVEFKLLQGDRKQNSKHHHLVWNSAMKTTNVSCDLHVDSTFLLEHFRCTLSFLPLRVLRIGEKSSLKVTKLGVAWRPKLQGKHTFQRT